MGSIIREDTEGEPSAALTETGKGGLLSTGYLRDAPAREYVGDGETPVFVLTDDDVGVEREQGSERTAISPGKGYRAITVVTDRRVIILVGNADDSGDKRVTLPHVEVTAARARTGALVLEMSSGVTWRCQADSSGIEEVADYVDAAAETWRDVEATLDSVKRSIVDATGHRDAGDYEAAIDAMRDARDDIEAVQERTTTFSTEWPAEAMVVRVHAVRDRCLRTAAEIRVGHARATIDDGEAHWRDGEYERARDAFEEAREAYEAVRALAPRHRSEVDDIDRAIERLDRSMERLDDAPLRNAIDADRRAKETEPSIAALDALEDARERYGIVLELGPEDGERRFAGDRDRIREQREDVTDRFVATALEVGTDALEAGEWYTETGQTEFAVEELERAVEALDRGIAVAETERPARVEELRRQRSSAYDRLAELDAETNDAETSDGDVERSETEEDDAESEASDDEVGGAPPAEGTATDSLDATAADGGVATASVLGNPGSATGRDVEAPPVASARHEESGVEATLRDLGADQFERVVTAVVEAMGWRPEPTASAACDFLAEREGSEGPTLAIRSLPSEDGDPIDGATMEDAADLASSIPTVDEVMVVTTRPLTDDAIATARHRRIRLVDGQYLAAALGGPTGDGDREATVDELA